MESSTYIIKSSENPESIGFIVYPFIINQFIISHKLLQVKYQHLFLYLGLFNQLTLLSQFVKMAS